MPIVTSIDYEKTGFRCGLELHQQLEGRKLFCNCRTLNSDKNADIKFHRKLKAVIGESGDMDLAAEFEMSKNKKFVYECSSQDTCLVEFDDEPPHELNREALEIAIKTALLLNASLVDEIQFMRKIVIDGSNVSGFQRSALIAMDGFIETSLGKVGIPTICLEEEAAQKIREANDFVEYRLDRMGIPLIEIATDTGIKNPGHAKEVAGYIGMVFRSIEGVKRGLGTIRQDVNISINSGARTEIKGFQDLRSIQKVIDYEVKRQLSLIEQGKQIQKEVRKAEQDLTTSFLRPLPGAARLYPETDVLPVRVNKEHIERLRKQLPKLLVDKLDEFEKKFGLLEGMGKELIDTDFEYLANKNFGIEPIIIAKTLINLPIEYKRKLNANDFEEVFSIYAQGKIAKEAITDLLGKKSMGEKINPKDFASISEHEIEQEIRILIKDKPGLNQSAYMGLIMSKFRGKIDGKKVMEVLKRVI